MMTPPPPMLHEPPDEWLPRQELPPPFHDPPPREVPPFQDPPPQALPPPRFPKGPAQASGEVNNSSVEKQANVNILRIESLPFCAWRRNRREMSTRRTPVRPVATVSFPKPSPDRHGKVPNAAAKQRAWSIAQRLAIARTPGRKCRAMRAGPSTTAAAQLRPARR